MSESCSDQDLISLASGRRFFDEDFLNVTAMKRASVVQAGFGIYAQEIVPENALLMRTPGLWLNITRAVASETGGCSVADVSLDSLLEALTRLRTQSVEASDTFIWLCSFLHPTDGGTGSGNERARYLDAQTPPGEEYVDMVECILEDFEGSGISSAEDLVTLLVRFRHNTHAGGVFPLAALFNHSCRPNAETTLVKRPQEDGADDELAWVEVRALKKIDAGEQICVSYLEEKQQLLLPGEERRSMLKNFDFTCSCERCKKGD